MLNFFKVLGISPSADYETAKKAYRRLAGLHHPDVNGGSEESATKFKEINEAWQLAKNYYNSCSKVSLWAHSSLFQIIRKECSV